MTTNLANRSAILTSFRDDPRAVHPHSFALLYETVFASNLNVRCSSFLTSKDLRQSARLRAILRWKYSAGTGRHSARFGVPSSLRIVLSGSIIRNEAGPKGWVAPHCIVAPHCCNQSRFGDSRHAVRAFNVEQSLISEEESRFQCLAMADPSANPTAGGPPVKEYTIVNKEGLKLKGLLVESTSGSKEVCILCHGFRSSKLSGTLSSLSNSLVEAGVSTFRFDFAGNGQSEGVFAYGNYWREVEDLRAVVEFWTSKGSRVVCVTGHSKGGNCVVLYASKYHDVPCVINISGRFALEKGVLDRLGGQEGLRKLEEEGVLDIKDASGEVQYKVTKADLRDRLTTNMHAACLAIPESTQVLTIHGTKDEVVPADDAYQFAQRIQNHKLLLLKDADHSYRAHQSDLAKHVLEFLQHTLQS